MKKIKFLTIILGLFLSSCTKDLVPIDYSEINPSVFPKTEADLQTLVNSAYYPLRGGYSSGIFTTSENGLIWLDGTTEILRHNSAAHRLEYDKKTALWTRFYDVFHNKISLMTVTLDQLMNSEVGSEKFKKKAIAEVRMARAMLSYHLFDLYGPLVVAPIEVLKNPLEEKPLARLSHEEMVNFIEADLIAAAEDLPSPAEAEYGRFSKGIAKMVLIRLYLHEKNWAKVLSAANDIINYQYYTIDPDYVGMFGLTGAKKSREVIWAIPCDYEGISSNQWQLMTLPSNYPVKGGWGSARSTWWFYDTFEEPDVRKTMLITEYKGMNGITYNRENPGSFLNYGPIPLKIDPDEKRTTSVSTVDIIVYRYADVLLSKAEAIANLSGPNNEAMELVNVIRRRAGLQDKNLSDASSLEEFNDLILTERSHEYWAENGQYRSDLIRMGKYVSRNILRTASKFANDSKILMPFSQDRINEGKGLFIQNPGYD